MKKLLFLGSSSYIVPVIKTAHDLGIYVLTCDYIWYTDPYAAASVCEWRWAA